MTQEQDAKRYRYLASMFEAKRNGWWLDSLFFECDPSVKSLDNALDLSILMDMIQTTPATNPGNSSLPEAGV